MAGGLSKALGVILLVAGAALIVAGGAIIFTGHEDKKEGDAGLGGIGVVPDEEKQEQGEQQILMGAVAAGAGVVGLIVGIIFLVVGGGRARRAHAGDLAKITAAAAAPAKAELATRSVEPPHRKRVVTAGVAIGAVLLLGLGITVAVLLGDDLTGGALGDDEPDATAGALLLYPEFIDGGAGADSFLLSSEPDAGGVMGPAVQDDETTWVMPTSQEPLHLLAGEVIVTWSYKPLLVGALSLEAVLAVDGHDYTASATAQQTDPAQEVLFEVRIPLAADVDTKNVSLTATLTTDRAMGQVEQDLSRCSLSLPVRLAASPA